MTEHFRGKNKSPMNTKSSSTDLEVVEEIFHVVAGLLVERLTDQEGELQYDNEHHDQDERSSSDLTL